MSIPLEPDSSPAVNASSRLRSKPHSWRNWGVGVVLLLLSGIMMTLSFPSWGSSGVGKGGGGLWFLAPVCLVPWGICILRRPTSFRWLLAYYLFASAWFFFDLFWLWTVHVGATLALSCYVAIYWVLFAFALRRMVVHLRWPALLALPVAWVCAEYLRATIFSGFAWFLLGNALAGWPVLIQIADLGGVWLLSFFAAMTAGMVVDLLRLPLFVTSAGGAARGVPGGGKFNPRLRRLLVIYATVLVGVLVYGGWRLNQAAQSPGPRVAVVQENIPQDQKDSSDDQTKRAFFQSHVDLSRQAAAEHPDLIAWPETMVPKPINPEVLVLVGTTPGARDYIEQCRQYDRDLGQLAAGCHSYLLVGAPYFKIMETDQRIRQNAAVLYVPGNPAANVPAGQDGPHYAKRVLVPFGEYIPFDTGWPWLHRMLIQLTPESFSDSLTPGDSWRRFEIAAKPRGERAGSNDAERRFRFGTPICYEDVMPGPCWSLAHPASWGGGGKQVDFLVSISNDGWYHSRDELDQHRQMDQIRAVENRVPIARSVNGGASGFVDSNGRVVGQVERDGRTHFVAGFAVMDLRVDRRISLYSRIGDLLPLCCGLAAALAVAWTLVRPRLGPKTTVEPVEETGEEGSEPSIGADKT